MYDVIKLKDGRVATIIEIHEKSVWVETLDNEILMLDKADISLN